ncbi:hypothetical protein HMPREF0731_3807 [Pseudoroseomonas cervicalis ATCC 49957]|uniref:Uncharacterized protein n=1 Tax=Pseudoroseomonas cervicalis ATCC 49957 TaxID=525371 RepID=D5RRU5_9PROT|nr:hypothetical protein HMPREF0731_3807 [Pseudoroseomonas cervicalis ATCC 49957]
MDGHAGSRLVPARQHRQAPEAGEIIAPVKSALRRGSRAARCPPVVAFA